jgi:RNA polymerase sigma-70 factor (ECF subfamily)
MIGPGADQRTAQRHAPVRDLSGLALAAQHGTSDDVEALLERVRTIAHRYSWARLSAYPGGLHLADDVAQDICLAVFRALPRYRDHGRPFEAFVHGVASRKVADARRALAKHPLPTAELPEKVDDAPTPEDTVVRSSEAETASELLHLLPERLREIMMLRVGAGMSAEETAAALGMTPGAVRVAQHRALAKIRLLVEGRDDD